MRKDTFLTVFFRPLSSSILAVGCQNGVLIWKINQHSSALRYGTKNFEKLPPLRKSRQFSEGLYVLVPRGEYFPNRVNHEILLQLFHCIVLYELHGKIVWNYCSFIQVRFIHSLRQGASSVQYLTYPGHSFITSISWSPGGRLLVSGSASSGVMMVSNSYTSLYIIIYNYIYYTCMVSQVVDLVVRSLVTSMGRDNQLSLPLTFPVSHL